MEEDVESDHVEKPDGHTSGDDKVKERLVDEKSKKKRHHSISSEHDSSEDQEDEPPRIKVPKKGDPSLVKKRKVLKPKGKKNPPSAAAGSPAQLQGQGNQNQMPFVNPNLMQGSGFQQNQDPFAMMANFTRWMFNNQMPQGQVQGPQPQNTPLFRP